MACNQPTHTQTSCQHTSHNFHFGQVPSHGLQTAHSHTNITSTHQPQLLLWPGTFLWPANRPFTHKHLVNTPATTFTLARYLLMACKPPIHTQTSHQHTSHNLYFGQGPSRGLQTAHSHTNITSTQPQPSLWQGTPSQTSCRHNPSHNFHFGKVPPHKHHVNTTPATTFI